MEIKENIRKSLVIPIALDEKIKRESRKLGVSQKAYILMCVHNQMELKGGM